MSLDRDPRRIIIEPPVRDDISPRQYRRAFERVLMLSRLSEFQASNVAIINSLLSLRLVCIASGSLLKIESTTTDYEDHETLPLMLTITQLWEVLNLPHVTEEDKGNILEYQLGLTPEVALAVVRDPQILQDLFDRQSQAIQANNNEERALVTTLSYSREMERQAGSRHYWIKAGEDRNVMVCESKERGDLVSYQLEYFGVMDAEHTLSALRYGREVQYLDALSNPEHQEIVQKMLIRTAKAFAPHLVEPED